MASRIRVPHRIQHELERAESLVDRRRVGQMIDRNFDEMRAGGGGGAQIIDMGDSAVYTGYSKPFYPLLAGTLNSVRATLSAAGTTDTQANIFHNSTNVGLIVVPAGELLSAPLDLGLSMAEEDFWQALVVTAGASATGLTFWGDFS